MPISHTEIADRRVAITRMTWMHLIYPMSTEEPAIAGRGPQITTTYVIPQSPAL